MMYEQATKASLLSFQPPQNNITLGTKLLPSAPLQNTVSDFGSGTERPSLSDSQAPALITRIKF